MSRKEKIRTLQKAVLGWFRVHERDLPWRRTADPWQVLLSEVMLQQTQVDRVAPKFLEFVSRWPTPARFADASLGEVLRAWSGLGYNRRAANLWRASQAIVERHGGEVPRSVAALEALPGIGTYTSRAVASFAWNDDVALWDTNVRRIFLRVFQGGEFASEPPAKEKLEALLADALPAGRSREWHGALMDFGSSVCTSRAPSCATCPAAAICKAAPAFREGREVRSALQRKQARFEGSARQVRGAVLKRLSAVASGSRFDALVRSLDIEKAAVVKAVEGLEAEGLVRRKGGKVSLPR